MMDKKNSVSATETPSLRKNTIDTSIIPHPSDKKHLVYFDVRSYKQQPTAKNYEFPKVVKRFKNGLPVQNFTIEQILQEASKGRCFLPYNYETINDQITFISSRLFFIDIDDEDDIYNPSDVLKALGTKVAGLYYTFSHGKEGKGNRYRLAFEVDRTITDERQYRSILKYLANMIAKKIDINGKMVDKGAATHLVQPIRGGLEGYELVEDSIPLNVDELMPEVEKFLEEEQEDKQYKLISDDSEYEDITYEQLVEMCECIGPIGFGEGYRSKEVWVNSSYILKFLAITGVITEDEGFNLLCMISQNIRQADYQWRTNKPRGEIKVGSLIRYAREHGYKGKVKRKKLPSIKHEADRTIKVDRYIPSEVSKQVIEERSRILIDSPTGSGKSVSFTKAFADIECTHLNTVNIIAFPTKALTRQQEKNTNYMCIQGKTTGLYKRVKEYLLEGNRNFVATYDKTPELIQAIEKANPELKFNLVIDEYHRLVIDFSKNFRHEQIKNLKVLGQHPNCISFIGLSGTIDDINKDEFDKVYKIDNGLPGSPNKEFKVYTSAGKGMYAQFVNLIQERAEEGYKLLVFIQNLDKIQEMKKVLKRNGINVKVVTADDKLNNPTFKEIVDHERVADDVQVILASPVIADGVSIQNNPEDKWEVIAACTNSISLYSPIFNPSVIKQMSNRLRNTYERFSIFVRGSADEKEGLFNTDAYYRYKLKKAQQFVEDMNSHVHFDADDFHGSKVEELYGIRLEGDRLIVDEDDLRHIVVKDKERYYQSRPNDFIAAVEDIMHMQQIETVNLLKNVDDIQALIDSLKDADDIDINTIFTKEVYEAIKIGHQEVLQAFKEVAGSNKYHAAVNIVKYADYETSFAILKEVTSKNKIYDFTKELYKLYELDTFRKKKSFDMTKTSDVIRHANKLSKAKKIVNGKAEELTLDEIIEQIRLITDVDRSVIHATINKFFITKSVRESKKDDTDTNANSREKRKRIKYIVCIKSFETLAKKYGLSQEQVESTYEEYLRVEKLVPILEPQPIPHIPLDVPITLDFTNVYPSYSELNQYQATAENLRTAINSLV